MPNKLDLEIFRYKNMLFGSVLHQDEELRCLSGVTTLAEVIGFAIKSADVPILYTNALYVRGENKLQDNIVVSCRFGSEQEAKEACARIRMCLASINQDVTAKELGPVVKEV